jgi:DNA repair exonuclease SbcCD nuclease subunit
MKIFKLLVTADLHLSNSLPHARVRGEGVTDRFATQMDGVKQMVKIAKDRDVDAILIVGDLYDKRTIDALTLRGSIEALVGFFPVGVLIVPGNHEANSDGSQRYLPEFFEEAGHDHISLFSSEDVVSPTDWLSFHSLPYASQDLLEENLASIRSRIKKEDPRGTKQHHLFAHVPVQGAKVGSWSSDLGLAPSVLEPGFTRVFLGHYHVPQELTSKTICVGSPWQLNFGESEVPGEVLLVTFRQDGAPTIDQRIPILAPHFHTIKGTEVIYALEAGDLYQSGDYLRIEIESTHADFPEKRAKVEPYREELERGGSHVKVIHNPIYHHEDRMGRDPEEVLSLEEMVSSYPGLVTPEEELAREELRKVGLDILRQAQEEVSR